MKTLFQRWWSRDLVIWAGLYALWIVFFRNRTITVSHTMGVEFCYLVFIAINFYFNSYIFLPKLLNEKKYALFILATLSLLGITALMRAAVAIYINRYVFYTPILPEGFAKLYVNSFLNIFFWTECMVAAKIISDKIKFQRIAESVEKENILNELNFLRAQTNPHFLFNSLNSIYFQISKTNKDARETLMTLSEMLRYQLYECSSEKVPVDSEIRYLKNYVALQKLRLNANYKINFSIKDNLNNFGIAPLLIMPLIENAFKYVSHYNHKSNEINIEFSMNNNLFNCNVRNTIEKVPGTPLPSEGGIGLKNLKRRLELLYPSRHKLTCENDEKIYAVELILNLEEGI